MRFQLSRLRLIYRAVIVLASAVTLYAGAAAPVRAATGKETVEKLVTLFKSWDTGAPPKTVFSEAASYIDYGAMSEQALGADQWTKLKPAERTQFTNALRKLVEQRYYPRWHKLFSKGSLTYGQESTAGGGTVLNSILKVNKKSQDVVWRFGGNNPPKVVSLKVEEKDLLNSLHDRISPRLKKSGFSGLLSWLQNRAAQETED